MFEQKKNKNIDLIPFDKNLKIASMMRNFFYASKKS